MGSLLKQGCAVSGCDLSSAAWHKQSFRRDIIPFASSKSIHNSKEAGSLQELRCQSHFNPVGDTKLMMAAEELNSAKLLSDRCRNLPRWIDLQMETKADL